MEVERFESSLHEVNSMESEIALACDDRGSIC